MVLVSLLLTLNIFHTLLWRFHYCFERVNNGWAAKIKNITVLPIENCIQDAPYLSRFRIFCYAFAIQVTPGNVVKLELIQLLVVGLTVELMDTVLFKTATQCASVIQNGLANNANSHYLNVSMFFSHEK